MCMRFLSLQSTVCVILKLPAVHKRLVILLPTDIVRPSTAYGSCFCTAYRMLQVCDGYRPPRPERLPDAVWCLIEECWHDDPVRRPPMDVVLTRLRELRDQEAAQPTDSSSGAMGGCGCVVS